MFTDKYGGKQAFLRYAYHQSLHRLGRYKYCTNIDWKQVRRLVFICTGNINRSPYAEYKARQLGMESVSYGIDADESKTASEDAIRNANKRLVRLDNHQCKSINNIIFRPGDLLLGMEPKHLLPIHKMVGTENIQTTLLGLWRTNRNPYIQDPIGRSDIYYQNCFKLIDESLEEIQRLYPK